MLTARAFIDFAILLLGAYGLGIGAGGLRLLSGTLLIPIGLYFSGIILRMPPSIAAKALLLFALLRLGYELFRSDRRKLLHPALLLPVIHFGAVFSFVRKPFTLHGWDEFSHWGLMPKQILLFDKVTDAAFPYDRFLDYTPGWPLLLGFPQLVQGSGYRTDHLIFAVVLISAGVAASVWDVVRQATSSVTYAWIASLLVARLYLGGCLYPTGIMSEFPLDAAYCATMVLGLRWVLGQRDRLDPLWWGIVLCGGYLIKKSFLSTLPIFIWLSIEFVRTARGRQAIGHMGNATWLPLVTAAATWHSVSRGYPHVFKFVPEAGISIPMIRGMFQKSGEFLAFYWYLTAIAVAGFWFGLREKRVRRFFVVLLGFGAIYLFSLYWLYRTTFPGREGEELASFKRYFQSLFGPCLFATTVFLFVRFRERALGLPKWVLQTAVAVLALANLEQLQLSIVTMNKYGAPSPVVAQAPALIRLLEQRGWRGREIWMVYEAEGGIVNWQAIYASIDTAGPRAFTTSSVFDPEFSGMSEQAMKEELARHQVVWPVAIGKKTALVLARLMSPTGTCPDELTKAFWTREESGRWTCTLKE